MEEYSFRSTYRQDASTYIEDRGVPHYVRRGDDLFDVLDAKFSGIIHAGQTAVMTDGTRWEAVEGFPLLEAYKKEKLALLHKEWLKAEAEATVEAGGAVLDANERANRDVSGLIVSMEENGLESTTFCCADNTFRELTLDQLKAVRLAIIAHAQALYERKWTLRTQIQQAQTFGELERTVISFEDV